MTPKGKQLEEAVKAIETAILQGEALGERCLSIESNRVLVLDGVKHEIDIFVRIKLGNSYDATYLFESKNWAEPVGKDPLIVFAEKIRATGAARGFCVAPAFTEYAVAQARHDPRIVLLNSTEHHISPAGFRCLSWGNEQVTIRDAQTAGGPVRLTVHTPVIFGGKEVPFVAVMQKLGERMVQTRIAQSDVCALADGSHDLSAIVSYNLPTRGILVDGIELKSVTLSAKFNYQVTTPKLLYGYDVKIRGMFLKFEGFQLGDQTNIDGLTITGNGRR